MGKLASNWHVNNKSKSLACGKCLYDGVMIKQQNSEMRLYLKSGDRLYVNQDERLRFLAACETSERHVRTFCMTLAYTGCRISEALELTVASVQLEQKIISIHSLKKRNKHIVREVPIPNVLADALGEVHEIKNQQNNMCRANNIPLWPISRSTAWRQSKLVMRKAHITGAQATPKGLRHGYGIHAMQSGIQLNMLQKWMGHADMKTTAIYANAVGKEEQDIAARMWEE